ncbi:hypothetical protein Q9L58_005421 [Maublancomyces gigas]|uniref:Uncharacterized protein n=1 Tax=Discina gigas TaxID=1032678 RepID=A0ABR3GI41_9PEZI
MEDSAATKLGNGDVKPVVLYPQAPQLNLIETATMRSRRAKLHELDQQVARTPTQAFDVNLEPQNQTRAILEENQNQSRRSNAAETSVRNF